MTYYCEHITKEFQENWDEIEKFGYERIFIKE